MNLAVSLVVALVAMLQPEASAPPPKPNAIQIDISKDRFKKTITREFLLDIGAASTKPGDPTVTIVLWTKAVAEDTGGEPSTPTNMFSFETLLESVSEDQVRSLAESGNRMRLDALLDSVPMKDKLRGTLPKPPRYAQQVPVIFGRRDCLLSSDYNKRTGHFEIIPPMWIEPAGLVEWEPSGELFQKSGDKVGFGFTFATPIVQKLGQPRKIELKISPAIDDGDKAQKDPINVEFSLTTKQWNQIRDFAARIQRGR